MDTFNSQYIKRVYRDSFIRCYVSELRAVQLSLHCSAGNARGIKFDGGYKIVIKLAFLWHTFVVCFTNGLLFVRKVKRFVLKRLKYTLISLLAVLKTNLDFFI